MEINSKLMLLTFFISFNIFARPTSNIQDLIPIKDQTSTPNFTSKLPQCQGDDPRYWNKCVGYFVFPNQNAYYGEWENGQREGLGHIKIVAKGASSANYIGSDMPANYVGEFHGGRINGHGVWIDENGDRYEGYFLNNILINLDQRNTEVFVENADRFRSKCESLGLKYGTGDFAQCVLKLEEMSNQNNQTEAQQNPNVSSTVNCQTNWFAIASAFSKPQLGGFTASLGSASQELARQKEANGCQ